MRQMGKSEKVNEMYARGIYTVVWFHNNIKEFMNSFNIVMHMAAQGKFTICSYAYNNTHRLWQYYKTTWRYVHAQNILTHHKVNIFIKFHAMYICAGFEISHLPHTQNPSDC